MQEKWEAEAEVKVDAHNQKVDKLEDRSYSCRDKRLARGYGRIGMILRHDAEHYIVFARVSNYQRAGVDMDLC